MRKGTKGTERGVSLSIDIMVPDVGRIQKRIGTNSSTRRDDYLSMIRSLQREARLDVLRHLRDGVLSFALVYEKFAKGELNKLPSPETLIPLEKTWRAWMQDLESAPDGEQISAEHLSGHGYSLTRLLRELGAAPSVADLPLALEGVRKTYRRMPRSFNKTMASARAFLRDTLRTRHALYAECAAIPVLPWKRARQPQPQTVAQLLALKDSISAELYAIVWSLASTGMIPKEYWEDGWQRTLHHLHIAGQKRGARDRDIPDLGRCVIPSMSHDAASRALAKSGATFVLKDLRNTFANWMEHAAIPRTRRKMYLGHGAADVTDLYEQQEVVLYLKDDGAKLNTWLSAQGASPATTENPNILRLEKAV